MKYMLLTLLPLFTGCAAFSVTSGATGWAYTADSLTENGEMYILQKARIQAHEDLKSELEKLNYVYMN